MSEDQKEPTAAKAIRETVAGTDVGKELAAEMLYHRIDMILAQAGLPVGIVATDRVRSTPDKIVLLGEGHLSTKAKAEIVMAMTANELDPTDPQIDALLGFAAELTAEAVAETRKALQRPLQVPAADVNTLKNPVLVIHSLAKSARHRFEDIWTWQLRADIGEGENALYDVLVASASEHFRTQGRALEHAEALIELLRGGYKIRIQEKPEKRQEGAYADGTPAEPLDQYTATLTAEEAAVEAIVNAGPDVGTSQPSFDSPPKHRLGQIPASYWLERGNVVAKARLAAELHQWGFINLDANGEPSILTGKPPVIPYDNGLRFECPRSAENGQPMDAAWTLDGNTCTYCGSLNPDELMGLLETGEAELSPTDKDYKVYVQRANPRFGKKRICGSTTHERPGYEPLSAAKYLEAVAEGACRPQDYKVGDYVLWGDEPPKTHEKFYFQHLSEEQKKRFIELLNAKKLKIRDPGHFYKLPFFCVAGGA